MTLPVCLLLSAAVSMTSAPAESLYSRTLELQVICQESDSQDAALCLWAKQIDLLATSKGGGSRMILIGHS